MFTEYKFSPADLSQQAIDTAKRLGKNLPGVNPATFAASTIAERLNKKPASYLQYGPYWWALKAALRALGHDFGASDATDIRVEYGGGFPAYGAIVAAEQFRDYYGANFLAGTDRFDLDSDGEQSYVLFDTDMEIRKLGASRPLRVAAAMQAVELEAESESESDVSILDATLTPFAVKFEYEANLWTAHVYALDSAGAAEKFERMQSAGYVGRAIDLSKVEGDARLDSSCDDSLYVDHAKRSVSEMASSGALARG